jgi:hypothetical protein
MTRLLALLASLALAGPAWPQASVIVPATTNTISVAGTVATITKIISGVAGKSIYITQIALIPVATSVVTFSQGSGTNCGTNTSALTGALTFAAGQTYTVGAGNGAVLALAQGNDLCVTIGTAAAPGSLAYSQF